MEVKKSSVSENVSRQLTALLEQSGITVAGLAFATKMSVNHLRTIKLGKASISSKTAEKICSFFEVEIETLFSSRPMKLKKPERIQSIKQFYEENKNNSKFFIDRQKESSIAHFLRTVIIPDDFLETPHDVGEIREHCEVEYKRKFNSKEISRQLGRLVDEGVLEKEDKFKNGTVYLYFKKRYDAC